LLGLYIEQRCIHIFHFHGWNNIFFFQTEKVSILIDV
jgi:hypothetical protein